MTQAAIDRPNMPDDLRKLIEGDASPLADLPRPKATDQPNMPDDLRAMIEGRPRPKSPEPIAATETLEQPPAPETALDLPMAGPPEPEAYVPTRVMREGRQAEFAGLGTGVAPPRSPLGRAAERFLSSAMTEAGKAYLGFTQGGRLTESYWQQALGPKMRRGDMVMLDPKDDPDNDPGSVMARYFTIQDSPRRSEREKQEELSRLRTMPGYAKARSIAIESPLSSFQPIPAEGVGGKVEDMLGSVAYFLVKMAVLKKAGGKMGIPAPVAGAAAMEISGTRPGQPKGEGAGLYAVMTLIDAMPGKGITGQTVKTLASMGLFGGVAVSQGADIQDAVISGLVVGAMRTPRLMKAWKVRLDKAKTTQQRIEVLKAMTSAAEATLRVLPGSTDTTVRRAYRTLAKVLHPDTPGGSDYKIKVAIEAYNFLSGASKEFKPWKITPPKGTPPIESPPGSAPLKPKGAPLAIPPNASPPAIDALVAPPVKMGEVVGRPAGVETEERLASERAAEAPVSPEAEKPPVAPEKAPEAVTEPPAAPAKPTEAPAPEAAPVEGKQVDEIMYHASPTEVSGDIDASDRQFGEGANPLGDNIGAFFTSSREGSTKFGENVYERRVRLSNPLRFKTQEEFRAWLKENTAPKTGLSWAVKEYGDLPGEFFLEGKNENGEIADSKRFDSRQDAEAALGEKQASDALPSAQETIRSMGYDGVVIEDAYKDGSESWAIVFDAKQAAPTSTESAAPVEGKQPWEMTREEFSEEAAAKGEKSEIAGESTAKNAPGSFMGQVVTGTESASNVENDAVVIEGRTLESGKKMPDMHVALSDLTGSKEGMERIVAVYQPKQAKLTEQDIAPTDDLSVNQPIGAILIRDGKAEAAWVAEDWRGSGVFRAMMERLSERGIEFDPESPRSASFRAATAKRQHKVAVQQAISEGEKVPESVLADYPDLAKQATPAPAKPDFTKPNPMAKLGEGATDIPHFIQNAEPKLPQAHKAVASEIILGRNKGRTAYRLTLVDNGKGGQYVNVEREVDTGGTMARVEVRFDKMTDAEIEGNKWLNQKASRFFEKAQKEAEGALLPAESKPVEKPAKPKTGRESLYQQTVSTIGKDKADIEFIVFDVLAKEYGRLNNISPDELWSYFLATPPVGGKTLKQAGLFGQPTFEPITGKQKPLGLEAEAPTAPTLVEVKPALVKAVASLVSRKGGPQDAKSAYLELKKQKKALADKLFENPTTPMPEMESAFERATKGGMLFQSPTEQTNTPQFKRWFRDSKVVDKNGQPKIMFHATAAEAFTRFSHRGADIGIHFGTQGQAEDRIGYLFRAKESLPAGSRTYPVYLTIRNPLRLRDTGRFDAENLSSELLSGMPTELDKTPVAFTDLEERRIQEKQHPRAWLKEIRDVLISKGFDGIVYLNTGETAGAGELQAEYDRAWKRLIDKRKREGKSVSTYTLEDQRTPEYQAMEAARSAVDAHRHEAAEDSWIAFRPEQVKSAVGNIGAFDPNDPRILAQGARAKVTFDRLGKAWIDLIEGKADATSPMHEFGHVVLLAIPNMLTADEHIALAKAVGADPSVTDRMRWTRKQKEKANKYWEEYYRRGKAPTPELKSLFARIAAMFRRIYSKMLTKLPNDVKAVFDRMHGAQRTIGDVRLAKAASKQASELKSEILAWAEKEADVTPEIIKERALEVDEERNEVDTFSTSFDGRIPGEAKDLLRDHLTTLNFGQRQAFLKKADIKGNVENGEAEDFIATLPGGYQEWFDRILDAAKSAEQLESQTIAEALSFAQAVHELDMQAKIAAYHEVEGGDFPMEDMNDWIEDRVQQLREQIGIDAEVDSVTDEMLAEEGYGEPLFQPPAPEQGASDPTSADILQQSAPLPGVFADPGEYAKAIIRGERDVDTRAKLRKVMRLGRLDMQATQKELRELLKLLPPDQRGKATAALTNVTSDKAGVKAFIARVNTILERYNQKKAIEEVRKVLPTDAEIEKMDPHYRDPLREIKDGIDLHRMTAKTQRTLQKTAEFMAQEGAILGIPQEALGRMHERVKRLGKTALADMSTEDILELRDMIAGYVKLNELKSELGNWRDIKETRGAIGTASSEIQNLKRTWVARLEDVQDTRLGRILGGKFWKATINFMHRGRISGETGAELMGDTMHEYAYFRPLRGMERHARIVYDSSQSLHAALASVGYEWGGKKLVRLRTEKVTFTDLDGNERTATKAEVIGMMAVTDQPYTIRQISEGAVNFRIISEPLARGKASEWEGVEAFQIDQAGIDALRQEHPDLWTLATVLRDEVGKMRDALNKASLEYDGWEKFTEPDYWPIKTSAVDRSPWEVADPVEAWGLLLPENLPFTKKRTGFSGTIYVQDAFTTFFEHLHGSASYISMTPHIRKLSLILSAAPVKLGVQRTLGRSHLGANINADSFMRRRLQAMTMIATPASDEFDSWLTRTAHKTAIAWLSFSPSAPAVQPSGMFLMTSELSDNPAEAYKLLAIGLAEVMKHPKASREAMFDNSAILRDRFENPATLLVGAEAGQFAEQLGRDPLFIKGMRGLNHADTANGTVAFEAYRHGLRAEHPDWSQKQIDAEAGWLTTLAVGRTQNASCPLDYADLSLRGRKSGLLRWFTQFKSDTYATTNTILRAGRRYAKSDKGPMAKAKFVNDAIVSVLLKAGYTGAVRWGLRAGMIGTIALVLGKLWPREPEEEIEEGAWIAAAEAAEYIPGAGPVIHLLRKKAMGWHTKGLGIAESAGLRAVAELEDSLVLFASAILAGEEKFKTGPRAGESKTVGYSLDAAKKFGESMSQLLGVPQYPHTIYKRIKKATEEQSSSSKKGSKRGGSSRGGSTRGGSSR